MKRDLNAQTLARSRMWMWNILDGVSIAAFELLVVWKEESGGRFFEEIPVRMSESG